MLLRDPQVNLTTPGVFWLHECLWQSVPLCLGPTWLTVKLLGLQGADEAPWAVQQQFTLWVGDPGKGRWVKQDMLEGLWDRHGLYMLQWSLGGAGSKCCWDEGLDHHILCVRRSDDGTSLSRLSNYWGRIIHDRIFCLQGQEKLLSAGFWQLRALRATSTITRVFLHCLSLRGVRTHLATPWV